MFVSLTCASSWLVEDDCVVSYADIVYPPDVVRDLVAAPAAPIAITFDTAWRRLWETRFADPLSDAETFRRDAENRVIEIGNKPRTLDEIEGQYMGLLRFSPAGWTQSTALADQLPPAERDRLHMTGLLQRMITAGVAVRGVPVAAPWFECDSAEDVRLCEEEIAAGRLRL